MCRYRSRPRAGRAAFGRKGKACRIAGTRQPAGSRFSACGYLKYVSNRLLVPSRSLKVVRPVSSISPSGFTPPKAGQNGLGAILNLFLDRLEEWLIATLIGAATVVTFVAVVHRYGASNSAGLARWAAAHGFVLLRQAADWTYTVLAAINLSWAQELATYMFVWMAKFGAALGVRTGIHVGVDVLVKRLTVPARKPVIVFALL